MIKINYKKSKGGYTIIEMMIAVAVFLIVVTTGMGALLSANSLHQKSQDMRSIMDSLSFIMEDLSRNLRTGSAYHCFTGADVIPNTSSTLPSTPKSCANGWGLAFEPPGGSSGDNDDQWVYYINNGQLFKSSAGPYAPTSFVQLTADEIVLDSGSGFSIVGAEPPPANTGQPFVIVRLAGRITYKNIVTPFAIETSISQRLVDVTAAP
jgi:prepilin-type N-terminal cleavage/methylation domain-containing protein